MSQNTSSEKSYSSFGDKCRKSNLATESTHHKAKVNLDLAAAYKIKKSYLQNYFSGIFAKRLKRNSILSTI